MDDWPALPDHEDQGDDNRMALAVSMRDWRHRTQHESQHEDDGGSSSGLLLQGSLHNDGGGSARLLPEESLQNTDDVDLDFHLEDEADGNASNIHHTLREEVPIPAAPPPRHYGPPPGRSVEGPSSSRQMLQRAVDMHVFHTQQAEIWGKTVLELGKALEEHDVVDPGVAAMVLGSRPALTLPPPVAFRALDGPTPAGAVPPPSGGRAFSLADISGAAPLLTKGQRVGDGDDEQRFICRHNGCSKAFRFMSQLKAHATVHFAERPFSCDFCPKKFRQRSTLHAHRRTHTKDRPHVCEMNGCGMSFPTKAALVVHQRRHTGEKPFKCTYENCDKSFSTKHRLDSHLNSHTGARPFVCPFKDCDKSYTDRYAMQYHIRSVHEDAKKFECMHPNCDKRFVCKSELTMHYSVHTGDGYAQGRGKKRRITNLSDGVVNHMVSPPMSQTLHHHSISAGLMVPPPPMSSGLMVPPPPMDSHVSQ